MGSSLPERPLFNPKLWRRVWLDTQIVLAESIPAAALIFLLWVFRALLERTGLPHERAHLMEEVHFWFSFALMIVFPIRSVVVIAISRLKGTYDDVRSVFSKSGDELDLH